VSSTPNHEEAMGGHLRPFHSTCKHRLYEAVWVEARGGSSPQASWQRMQLPYESYESYVYATGTS
jgi:hypothetical protein